MKARLFCKMLLVLCLALGSALPPKMAAAANSDEAEIVEIDAKGLRFSITQNGQVRTFTVWRSVEVSINGQRATFEELEPGMKVKITAAETVANRIVANGIRTRPVGSKAPLGVSGVLRQLKAMVSGEPAEGYAIGDVRKGTTLSFKHVAGKWRAPAKDMSPDESTVESDKVALALPAEGGKPGQALAVLPAGTAKKPFVFVADKDFSGLVLRVNSDRLTGNHGGSVEYAVKVIPPGR